MFSPIDPIPTALRTQSQEVFDQAMAGFMTQLPTAIRQLNTAGVQTDANATTAANAAAAAVAQAGAAQAAVNVPKWVSDLNYVEGDCCWSPLNGQTYRRAQAGAGVLDPAQDLSNWRPVVVPALPVVVKAAAYIADLQDKSVLIVCTAGFILGFAAAQILGNGWFCYISNLSGSDVILDPNGAETINGAANYVLPAKSQALVVSDGAKLYVIGEKKQGCMVVQERQPSGTGGQAFVTGFNERPLNTVVVNTIPGAFLREGRISLPPGTYRVYARAPVSAAAQHQLTWSNSANGGVGGLAGSTMRGGTSSAVDSESVVTGQFTIAATGSFFLGHFVSSALAGTTGGVAGNFSNFGYNVFSHVELHQEA